ncbi:hypothetical protein HanIR_Chr01g0042671 [Helianthus annuus]|nr:hypothetical protein HanIR_Chr01g0042671 [Helianthus annuus]
MRTSMRKICVGAKYENKVDQIITIYSTVYIIILAPYFSPTTQIETKTITINIVHSCHIKGVCLLYNLYKQYENLKQSLLKIASKTYP